MKMISLSRGLVLGACAFVVLGLAGVAHAGMLDEENANNPDAKFKAEDTKLAQSSEQADACQKATEELNQALKDDKKTKELKMKKDQLCKQKFVSEYARNETATDSDTSTQEKVAGTEMTTKTAANFGGADDLNAAKVETAMPENLGSETAEKMPVNTPTETTTAESVTTEGAEKQDVAINVDGAVQTPDSQKTMINATELMNAGKIPDNAKDRAALLLQYAREKGMSEKAQQAMMQTLARENGSLNPALCNPKSSACGLGQYIDSTWASNCAKFGSRGSFQAQADCLINDVNKREAKYDTGSQTCGGRSFDACNYIQHFAGSYSDKAARLGYIDDALKVLRDTQGKSSKFFAEALSKLGGGDVSSILAAMKTSQDTGLGGTISDVLGFTGGNNGDTSVQDLVSKYLGLNNNLTGTTGGTNTISGGLNDLLSKLFGGGGGDDTGGSKTGSSGDTRKVVTTETTINPDGSIKTVKTYSDGLKLTTQTSPNGTSTGGLADTLKSLCGGSGITSADALTLMISKCAAALRN